MANLMGLLLGASTAKLRSIAGFWQIDADVESRTLVSRLYNEMTDEQAVKSLLERLNPREKLVLDKVVAVPKGWSTIRELSNSLPFSDEETDQILAGIEDAGLIIVETVRVFGNEILEGPVYHNRGRPSLQTTVALVPPDLLRIMQRIKQQIGAGDQREKSLHKLLGELDLPQIQLLCERWHLPNAQQRFKKELMLFIETTTGQARQVNEALACLGDDAQLVFKTVQDAEGDIPLAVLRRSLTLDEPSLKKAISALASLFLLQETYVDGERHLFIPSGVGRREYIPVASIAGCAPQEVPEPSKVPGTKYWFFFDLLVLLNYFQQHRVVLTVIERKIPRRVLTKLREQLTIAGKNGHGTARLDYLFHVARHLSLLENRGDRIVVGENVGEWAAAGIVAQADKLFRFWLADDLWKGYHSHLAPSLDAEFCHEMRHRMAACLKRFEPGKWYSVDSIVRCVVAESGLTHRFAPAPVPATEVSQSIAAEAHLMGVGIAHLFHWMSLVSLGMSEAGTLTAIQLTPLGAWVMGCEGARPPEYDKAKLNVNSNFEVTILEPDSLAWYHLLKFSLTVSVGRASIHQITKKQVQQAAYWSANVAELLAFLKERSKNGVPDNVVASVNEWSSGVKVVNLEKLIIMEVDAQPVLDELLACGKYAKWLGRRLSPTAVVVHDGPDVRKLMKEMRSDGYFPRIDY